MLGHRGLGDAELPPDGAGDLAGCALPIGEQFQDPAPDRIAQDVERVHEGIIAVNAYIRQV